MQRFESVKQNTIEAAYEQLIAEGYVKSKNRSGLYVEKIESSFNNFKSFSPNSFKEKTSQTNYPPVKYDFSSGQIDLSSFPYTQFRKTLTRCVDEYSKELLLYGNLFQRGHQRQAVVEKLGVQHHEPNP